MNDVETTGSVHRHAHSLLEVVERAVTAEGATTERIDPEGLDVLAPPHVQQALGLAEWSRLGFGPELPAGAERVTLESDWTDRLERLLGSRGRRLDLALAAATTGLRHELESLVAREVSLGNATYRLAGIAETRTRYALLSYRATAVSDEKREEVVHLCINESNSFAADALVEPLLARLREMEPGQAGSEEDPDLPPPLPAARVAELGAAMLRARVRARLAPFLAGMERRMARDLERLHTYHQDLRVEAAVRLAERARRSDPPESLERARLRIEAIEREYRAKVADLGRKYAMSVELRLTQALRVTLPVHRAEIDLLRRKNSRRLHLDWNALARRIEPLPCETCRAAGGTRWACDERLHLGCVACAAPCPACGKPSCRACDPGKCPNCRERRALNGVGPR